MVKLNEQTFHQYWPCASLLTQVYVDATQEEYDLNQQLLLNVLASVELISVQTLTKEKETDQGQFTCSDNEQFDIDLSLVCLLCRTVAVVVMIIE